MTENTIKIAPNELEDFQNETQGEEKYDLHILQGKVKIAPTKGKLSTGRRMVAGDRAEVTLEKGEGLYIRNIGLNDAKLEPSEVDA